MIGPDLTNVLLVVAVAGLLLLFATDWTVRVAGFVLMLPRLVAAPLTLGEVLMFGSGVIAAISRVVYGWSFGTPEETAEVSEAADPPDEDDASEPTACVACRGSIPAGTNTCPQCGWSYTARGFNPWRIVKVREMNVAEFRAVLLSDPNAALHLMLPDGDFVPAHFHVTEVGRVQKDFIDCGGTTRSAITCLLQVWVATDTAHRLTAGKLASVLKLAAPLLGSDDLPVEVEYERDAVSQFAVAGAEVTPMGVLFHLGKKHTDCLAPDKCGITGCEPAPGGTSCC